MKRREFLGGMTGAASWSFAAWADNPNQKRRIGILDILDQDDSASKARLSAFRERLRLLGWIETKNVEIDIRHAAGQTDRLYSLARELFDGSVDVFVTSGTPAVLAAQKASPSSPIVFATIGDPIGAGVVTSLSHPGGNITGLSLLSTDLSKKRLEILKELLPRLGSVAIFRNPNNESLTLQFRDTEQAGRTLGIDIHAISVVSANDFDAGVATAVSVNADALLLMSDATQIADRERIIREAMRSRLPVVGEYSQFAESGALLSYGPHLVDNWRRAADYVDKILKGQKPRDIPVEQPTRFELIVNMKTANAFNLTIPPAILARADELIE